MIEAGATHLGVATDHVIESFRNAFWEGYKTGEGMERALFASSTLWSRRSPPSEWRSGRWSSPGRRCPRLRGADRAGRDRCREGLHLDARQGSRAVRARRTRRSDRSPRSKKILDAAGVRGKFGVEPALDYRYPRAGRRCRRRLSGAFWNRLGHGCATAQSLRAHREPAGRRAQGPQRETRHCCSSSLRRSGPTRGSSAMWTSFDGAAPPPRSPRLRSSSETFVC